MHEKHSYEYTETDYSLKGFVETFETQLPVVIRVTEGYIGLMDEHSTYEHGSGDMYRVHGIKRQSRVLAVETRHNGKCFGIPLDYPMKFNLRRKNSNVYTDPLTMAEIVENYMKRTSEPLIIFIANPEPDTRLFYWDGPEKQDSVAMVEMELQTVYEEKYLMCHTIWQGKLLAITSPRAEHLERCGHKMPDSEKGSMSIPVFVPIKVEVAIGMEGGTKEDFQAIMHDMYMQCRSWAQDKADVNKDVLLFNAYDSDGNYEYIAPKVVIDVDHTKAPDISKIRSQQNTAYGLLPPRVRGPKHKPLPPLPLSAETEEEAVQFEEETTNVPPPSNPRPNAKAYLPPQPQTPLNFGNNILEPKPKPLPRAAVAASTNKDAPLPRPPPPPSPQATVPSASKEYTRVPRRTGPLPPVPPSAYTPLTPSKAATRKAKLQESIPIDPLRVIGEDKMSKTGPVDDSCHPILSKVARSVSAVPLPKKPTPFSKPTPVSPVSPVAPHFHSSPEKSVPKSPVCPVQGVPKSPVSPGQGFTKLDSPAQSKDAADDITPDRLQQRRISLKPVLKKQQSVPESKEEGPKSPTVCSVQGVPKASVAPTQGDIKRQGVVKRRPTDSVQARTGENEDRITPEALQRRLTRLRPVQPETLTQTPEEEYGDITQVPTDIKGLTATQLAECLRKIKLGRFAKAFEEEGMDGPLLAALKDKAEMEQIMTSVFCMGKLDVHKLWMFVHEGWGRGTHL